MYTKAQAIEQVYLRVNGKPTTQNSVKREDIEYYLSAAIAWAWGIANQERLDRMARNRRLNLPDDNSFTDLRLTQYITPQYDERKGEYYVEVNKIPNIGGSHYFEVSPVKGTGDIQKIDKRSDLTGLEDIIKDTTFCYYLQAKGQLPRIYLINLVGCEDCELEVTTMFDFSALGDDDYIQAPTDKEILIIDKCVDFFLGKVGEDNLIDQNDNGRTADR